MHSIRQCEDAQRTFSTLTRFWRTFSTLTVESFHDYGRLFYPLTLILFHDDKRSHMCDFHRLLGKEALSIAYSEKVQRKGQPL
jgi:hypothetical protein